MSSSKKVKYDMTPYYNYQNYLNNYDTSKVDNTIGNMENAALNFSNQLEIWEIITFRLTRRSCETTGRAGYLSSLS